MGVYCVSWLVIRLFHLTSFVWMFLEGRSQIEKVSRKFLWSKILPSMCSIFISQDSISSFKSSFRYHWHPSDTNTSPSLDGVGKCFLSVLQWIVERDRERISRDASAVEVYKLGLPFSIKWYWKTLDKAHLFQWSAICYLRICSCLNKETFRNFRFLI